MGTTQRSRMLKALYVELVRSVCSARFMLGVGLMLSWMVFNGAEAAGTYRNAVELGGIYVFQMAIENQISTGPVVLSIATIPYAFSYLTEKRSGYLQMIIGRTGSPTYVVCKALATAISAFLMGVVAGGTYVIILNLLKIPHIASYPLVNESYAVLAIALTPAGYYGIKIALIGLVCAQAALFALATMAWIPSSYVGFLAPITGYYLADSLISTTAKIFPSLHLWALINPFRVFFTQVSSSIGFSLLWTVLFLIELCIAFGNMFAVHVRKECIS